MKQISRRGKGLMPQILQFGGVLLLVLIAALILTVWRAPLSGFLLRLLTPLMSVRNALDATENAQLRGELAASQALLADREILHEENIYLKRLLGRNADTEVILGNILQRPPGTPYDTLLLDVGSVEGVVRGNLVSAGGSALIGRISEVYDHRSRVTLFSAPGEVHDGVLYRKKNETVVPLSVEGQGGGALFAEVPAGTGAEWGDLVLLSSIESGVSAAVVAVEAGESGSFETLHFHLPVNPNEIRFVEIRKSNTEGL